MDFSLRLGDVSTTRQLLNVVTLKNPDIFPISSILTGGGTVVIGKPSIRVDELPARGIWVIKISFTNLTPNNGYVYSVTQNAEVIDGSFQTLADNQNTPFAFIVGTCDGSVPRNPTNTFSSIRKLVESSTVPIVHMFIIDDVQYCDGTKINDPTTGLVSTGKPQDTGIAEDYAKAWAAGYGLIPSESKWALPDRQWVYRNVPCCYSGGDHAIAPNWCRGNADPKGGDRMLKLCKRGTGSLEDIAIKEWDVFYGNINPAPLRANQWYWGKEIGPVRLSLWDMSRFNEPYDSRLPTETQCYGGQQITDIMNYLDVSTHPFKIAFHESGLSLMGQPWLEYHRSEAQAWYDDIVTRPNLNGQKGNFISIYGDNHTVHTLKFDDFWAWSAGTLGDSSATNIGKSPKFGWGGILKYRESASKIIGDRFINNFVLVTVYADQIPKYIEISHIDGARGVKKYTARLTFNSQKNQMVEI